jgi:hypothetical protein
VALIFDSIGESARRWLLRYLFREHRRRNRRLGKARKGKARVTAISEIDP